MLLVSLQLQTHGAAAASQSVYLLPHQIGPVPNELKQLSDVAREGGTALHLAGVNVSSWLALLSTSPSLTHPLLLTAETT